MACTGWQAGDDGGRQCGERPLGCHPGLPGPQWVGGDEAEAGVDRERRVGDDRRPALAVRAVVAAGNLVEAMQAAIVGTQMNVAAQIEQGRRRRCTSEAQFPDAGLANIDLDRQAKAGRRAGRLAAARRPARCRQQDDPVDMQGIDAQRQPAAGRAAACIEGMPARRLEPQDAGTAEIDLDALGTEVAEQRAARADDGRVRHPAGGPARASWIVERPTRAGWQEQQGGR